MRHATVTKHTTLLPLPDFDAARLVQVQELAREHIAVVVALRWVRSLVDLLEADSPPYVALCRVRGRPRGRRGSL